MSVSQRAAMARAVCDVAKTFSEACRVVLDQMEAGVYYRWDLGYNTIIDWTGTPWEKSPRSSEADPATLRTFESGQEAPSSI
jgi:hypothetical protein